MRRKNTAKLLTLFLVLCLAGCGLNRERTARENVCLEGENVGGFKESKILKIIEGHASRIDSAPMDAVLDQKTWSVARREKWGKKVNVEATLELVMNSAEGEQVSLVVEEIRPSVTSDMLEKSVVEIGSFSTRLVDKSESRVNNIRIASEMVDFEKVRPGEEFSFNGTVGVRSSSMGYEKAPMFIKTEDGAKKAYEFGGGVCQVATTIYNAVLDAGMEVTERHEHSRKVTYVPRGMDASVVYGSMDLKFRNNRQYPVMIRVFVSDEYVTVKFLEYREPPLNWQQK